MMMGTLRDESPWVAKYDVMADGQKFVFVRRWFLKPAERMRVVHYSTAHCESRRRTRRTFRLKRVVSEPDLARILAEQQFPLTVLKRQGFGEQLQVLSVGNL